MHAGRVVALAGVAPIRNVHAAVRPIGELQSAEPRVGREQRIHAMLAHVARAAAFEQFHIRAASVLIQREQPPAIFRRPVVAEIDHRADVRVAAAERIRRAVARLAPVLRGVEVPVIRALVDEPVGVRIRIERVRPDEVRPGHRVPEMPVHRVHVEKFAVLIPVVPPRIRIAARDRLEGAPPRVIPPHAAAHHDRLSTAADHLHIRRPRGSATPVQPAIRAEAQPIGDVVMILQRRLEALDHGLRRTVRDIVAIAIGNEEHVRHGDGPHATEADLDAREHLQIVRENRAPIEAPIAVGVFKNHDAIAQAQIVPDRPFGVGVIFRHPQPPARVPGQRDGILHIRLRGKDGRLATRRQRHLLRSLRSRHERTTEVRLGVDGSGKIAGECGDAAAREE